MGESAIRPAAIGDNLDLVGDFVQPAFELVDEPACLSALTAASGLLVAVRMYETHRHR
jgi:hypothetical protein